MAQRWQPGLRAAAVCTTITEENYEQEGNDMWNREAKPAELTPLSVLVEEGFGASPGELVDRFAADGIAIDVDSSGRLAVAVSVADRLREERAEAERLAAEEAAEAEREAAERARVAAEEAAVVEARNQAERERHERYRARVGRLERAAGMTVVDLDREYRRSIIREPGTGMTLDARAAIEDRQLTLAELEAWVRDRFGDEIFEQAGAGA